jgi:hypothetical protein
MVVYPLIGCGSVNSTAVTPDWARVKSNPKEKCFRVAMKKIEGGA